MSISPGKALLMDAELLKKLGLQQQPFNLHNNRFQPFLSDALTMLLNVVQHNLAESGNLQLVKGEQGIGKTLFAHLLQQQLQSKASCFLLQAKPGTHARNLFEQMLKTYQQQIPASLKQCLVELVHHLKQDLQQSAFITIIIDNCDQIKTSNLEYILQSLEALNEILHKKLKLVLVGENRLESIISELNIQYNSRGNIHSSLLRPLNPHQYQSYFQHLLKQAGSVEPLTLSAKQIEHLHQQCKGIPACLNQAFIRLFSNNKPVSLSKYLNTRSALLALLFSSGTIFYLWLPKQVSNTQDTPRQIIKIPEQKPAIITAATTPVQNNPASLSAEIPPPAKQEKHSSCTKGSYPCNTQNSVAAITTADKKTQENIPEQKPQVSSLSLTTLDSKNLPDLRHYTIQLLASRNKTQFKHYLNKHFSHGNFFYYPKKGNKRHTLFVLLHGNYSRLQQARQVISLYPEAVKQNKPWIRRFQNISKELQE